MGYRSEVRCLIWGSEEAMGAFVIEHSLVLPHPAFSAFRKDLKYYVIEAAVDWDAETRSIPIKRYQVLDLHGEHWKWYEHYDDVTAWNDLMSKAEEAGLDVYFIRIGEGDGNDQDVESSCTNENWPFLSVGLPTIQEDIPEPIKTLTI